MKIRNQLYLDIKWDGTIDNNIRVDNIISITIEYSWLYKTALMEMELNYNIDNVSIIDIIFGDDNSTIKASFEVIKKMTTKTDPEHQLITGRLNLGNYYNKYYHRWFDNKVSNILNKILSGYTKVIKETDTYDKMVWIQNGTDIDFITYLVSHSFIPGDILLTSFTPDGYIIKRLNNRDKYDVDERKARSIDIIHKNKELLYSTQLYEYNINSHNYVVFGNDTLLNRKMVIVNENVHSNFVKSNFNRLNFMNLIDKYIQVELNGIHLPPFFSTINYNRSKYFVGGLVYNILPYNIFTTIKGYNYA